MPQIKTNIYGDYKVCIKCKNHADVIEKGKDYCVECWFEHIEGKKFEDVKKEIDVKAIDFLQNQDWTGNIRQLRNVVERLIILGGDIISELDAKKYF